jgi:hypothetical protein
VLVAVVVTAVVVMVVVAVETLSTPANGLYPLPLSGIVTPPAPLVVLDC